MTVVDFLTDVWDGTATGHFRAFHDTLRDPKLAQKFHGDFSTVAAELEALNEMGYGVYFVVNHGGNQDADITHATAIMIDIDHGAGLPSSWHLNPHIVLQRGENYHVYWLIEPTECIDQWREVCRRLIKYYGSDYRIKNPSRVMRLPGFKHCKDATHQEGYQVMYRGSHARYTLDIVARDLPTVVAEELTASQQGEVLYETDDPGTIERAVYWLQRAEPAIEGQGGDHATYTAACRLRDWGLPRERTLQLMMEYYNPNCEPPWEHDEMATKVDNVYQYARKPQGAGNPVSNFLAMGNVQPEPPTSPEPPTNAPLPDVEPVANCDKRGTNPYEVTAGLGYEKNHTENAANFMLQCYPGGTLRNYKDDWYWFDGKAWVPAQDDVMRSAMLKAMMNAVPSSSTVDGSLKILRSLVLSQDELGSFKGRDTENLVLVQNGILNTETGELEPHTPQFFSTNILPWEYDPTAQCPTWDRFLCEIFEGDMERARFVEEWIGYMMVRDYSFQKIGLFMGAPRSGKTTIANLVKSLVGDTSYMGIDLGGFAQDGIMESAINKTVLWVGDAGSIHGPQRQQIVDRLKTISGVGDVSISRKWKSAYYGRLPGRISITCNNLLAFSDDSGALAERFLICPFNKSFLGKEDPTLEKRLAAELPGIANRCIEGLRRLRARGRFVEPSIAQVEREAIKSRYSPLQAFCEAECHFTTGYVTPVDEIYSRYLSWATRERMKAVSRSIFVEKLRSTMRGRIEHGTFITSADGRRATAFKHLQLRDDSNDEMSNVREMFKQTDA